VWFGSNSYAPDLLLLNPSTGTFLVTTSNGTNTGSMDTLVNGLQMNFDGSVDSFIVSANILGPLGMIDEGKEQAGIMYGNDHDNFIKLVITANNGDPQVEFYGEFDGQRVPSSMSVPIRNLSNVQYAELGLIGNPTNLLVEAVFRISWSNAESLTIKMNNSIAITNPGRFFDVATKGGIIATHEGGKTFTATYSHFGISRLGATPCNPQSTPDVATPNVPFASGNITIGATTSAINLTGTTMTPSSTGSDSHNVASSALPHKRTTISSFICMTLSSIVFHLIY
jgi:hypothetical protein